VESVLEAIEDWFHELLVAGIMNNMTSIFDVVNERVEEIAGEVGTTPADFSSSIYDLISNLSENVIMPIAGIILTFIACYELIQLVISHNNLANFETWIFWKWIFKTFIAVTLITNTMNITIAVFDVAQYAVTESGDIITETTSIDPSSLLTMHFTLDTMDLGTLLTIFLESFVVQFLIYILSAIIFVIVYGRMIEIYLMVSLAPIPFSTFGNREQSMIGQNYLRSLFALGFQGFLIMICIGIYAVLIKEIEFTTDLVNSLWSVMGYTILLTFTLFKTGSVAKSILHAH